MVTSLRTRPVMWYFSLAAVVYLLQAVAHGISGGQWTYPSSYPRGWVQHLVQYDGHEYIEIATQGYSFDPSEQSNIAWFPLYPLTIRFVSLILGDPAVSAVLITLVAGAAAAWLWDRWLAERAGLEGTVRVVAWLALMVYPYAFYLYGIAYADAMFLAATLAAFLLVERGRPLVAGLCAALATADRPTGIAVAIGVLVVHLEHAGVLTVSWPRFSIDRARLRARDAAPALGFAGLAGYMLFLQLRFDEPFAFIQTQQHFRGGSSALGNLSGITALVEGLRQSSGTERLIVVVAALAVGAGAWQVRNRWSRARLIAALGAGIGGALVLARWQDFVDFPVYRTTTAVQALICLGIVALLPAVYRRFGFGYALFSGALVAIPAISTGDFMGAGRYVLAAFPVAAVVGDWLASLPRARVLVLAASAVTLLVLSVGFSYRLYLA